MQRERTRTRLLTFETFCFYGNFPTEPNPPTCAFVLLNNLRESHFTLDYFIFGYSGQVFFSLSPPLQIETTFSLLIIIESCSMTNHSLLREVHFANSPFFLSKVQTIIITIIKP